MKTSTAKQEKNYVLRRPFTKEEEEIIVKSILGAVMEDKETLRTGINRAINAIQKKYGYRRAFGSVAKKWYTLFERLPKNVQQKYKAVQEELKKARRQHITATDIVKIAEKHNRNPLHVLGVSGSVKPLKEEDLTVGLALQLTELNARCKAQAKLIEALSKQLAASNKYRKAFIALRYSPEGNNIMTIINALLHTNALPALEQERLIAVLRAGWPELFKEEAVYCETKCVTN
jgi:hypothetical protein